MKRRNLILLLGGASAGATSVGTGAFSSVEAERGVEVNVVDDDEAYLGLDDDAGQGLVRIKNQFAEDLTLTVTAALASGSGEVGVETDEGDGKGENEAGEDDGNDHADAGKIEIEIGLDDDDNDSSPPTDNVDVTIPTGNFVDVIAECDEAGTPTLELDFSGTVSATGTTVDKTREFSMHCESETDGDDDVTENVTGVKFYGGSGEVKILTTDNNGGGGGAGGSVSAKLYCEDTDGVTSSDYTDVSVNKKLDGSIFEGDCDGSVIGVEIEGMGVFEKSDRGDGNVVDKDDARNEPSWE